jgi:hypothetical protein
MTALTTLYKWFSDLKKPTGAQFKALIDSFFHKSEKIPMSAIDGLDRIVEGTASAQQLQNHLTDTHAHKELLDKKVDKVEGKGLSSNDFTNAYKQQLDALEDYDIELDESTTELKFKKGNNVLKRISLMFLDDEGTKLVYNKVNKNLELRDKRDNLLTSIPVSHFVSNIPTSIVVQNGKIKLMAGSEVIDENAISYNDLADKPELNYLPLNGGVLTPGDVVWYDGLKIAKSTAGWSTFLLGSNSVLDNTSWMIARNPQGLLMIQSTDNGLDTGLLLSNDFLKWKGSTFTVNNELTHTDKMFDAPIMRLHTNNKDFIALNSKDYKLNVKVGSAGRDDGEFKPVLASGYEIQGKDDNYILTAGGSSIHRKDLVSRVIDVKTSTFDITPENVGNTAHVYNNCSLSYNTMPLSSTFAVRKVFDGGEVKFTGSIEAIYTGDRVLNGKKGSTAIIDYGSSNDMIFVDIRNI